jgi:serine/threonine protein kinase
VAIKRLRLEDDESDQLPSRVIREVTLLRGLDHPNIVQLKDQIIDATECLLIFEYVPGDLHGVLKGHRMEGTHLPMEKVLRYSQDLFNGLHACHIHHVVHRDLKPQNLLIHPVDGLKICDFGLARNFSLSGGKYTPQVITLWYRCPELLLGCPIYGPEVDIWSSGCIFAEMATGWPMFPGDSELGTLFKIMQLLGSPTEASWPGFEKSATYWRPNFPKWPPTDLEAVSDQRPELGDAGMDLVRSLLAMSPAARLTSRKARAHAFFLRPSSA